MLFFKRAAEQIPFKALRSNTGDLHPTVGAPGAARWPTTPTRAKTARVLGAPASAEWMFVFFLNIPRVPAGSGLHPGLVTGRASGAFDYGSVTVCQK